MVLSENVYSKYIINQDFNLPILEIADLKK